LGAVMLVSSVWHLHYPNPSRTATPPSLRHLYAIFIPATPGTGHPTITDNTARWAFIGAVGLISATGLWALGVTVVWASLWPLFERPALFLVFAVAYSMIGRRISCLALPMGVASDFLRSGLQVMAMMLAFLPLSYLAAAPDFPLLDIELARLDALLFGFEWDAAARWVAGHPALDHVLQAAYFSSAPQAAAILLIGSIARPADRNGEFFWSFGIGLILTCAVFIFTPALGKGGQVGGYMEPLTTIRSGMWGVLDYSRAEGIITFPSFHATLAILFVNAVRRNRWALLVFVPLNALLIAATPTIGGHYLVDVPAGAIVAIASIAVTRALRRRLPLSLRRGQNAWRIVSKPSAYLRSALSAKGSVAAESPAAFD
jgi:hypothetical protein